MRHAAALTATLVFALRLDAAAQPATAFTDMNLIRMDAERVEPSQTVIVRGDRIVAAGPSQAITVPADAVRIDGAGRYLLPGLTDAHVHLEDLPWARARPDFGDAPLYLANGVTTVINLAGTPTELDWRRRVLAGELVGPTIYTSGPFVNEPRVTTPDEVERDIRTQAREGYDLIKYHEFAGQTTSGLSLQAYRRMIDTARLLKMPIVGHAPVNLGVDALLEARQPLAHVGMLNNIYFFPVLGHIRLAMVTVIAVAILLLQGLLAVIRGAIARVRGARPQSPALRRIRITRGWIALAVVVSALALPSVAPGGPFFTSYALRVVVTVCGAFIAAGTVRLAIATTRALADRRTAILARLDVSLTALAALVLTGCLAAFWIPVIWRSTDAGMARFARRLHAAGIPVQTTLVVYEVLDLGTRSPLMQEDTVDYLRAENRDIWRRQPAGSFPGRVGESMRRITAALNREGVMLVAGTDAMGLPLVPPGTSLHRELQLLRASGLTNYEAIRAATIAPAAFLGKESEFGTIAVGKRADLILVDGNPLENLDRLRQPAGVMTRGRWFTRAELDRMLAALKQP